MDAYWVLKQIEILLKMMKAENKRDMLVITSIYGEGPNIKISFSNNRRFKITTDGVWEEINV